MCIFLKSQADLYAISYYPTCSSKCPRSVIEIDKNNNFCRGNCCFLNLYALFIVDV